MQRSVRSSTNIPACNCCSGNNLSIASFSSCRHSAQGSNGCKRAVALPASAGRRSLSPQPALLQQIASWEANQTDVKHGVPLTWSLRGRLAGQSPQNLNTGLDWYFLPSASAVPTWQKTTGRKGYSCSSNIAGTASRINFQLLLIPTGCIFCAKASGKDLNWRRFGNSSVLCRIQQ